jgi:hypothetical protein
MFDTDKMWAHFPKNVLGCRGENINLGHVATMLVPSLWSKVMHYVRTMVPFGTQLWCVCYLQCLSLGVFGVTEGGVDAVVVLDTSLAGVLGQGEDLPDQSQTPDRLHNQLLD